MNGSPQESELEKEIQEFADCKNVRYLTNNYHEFSYHKQIIWRGLIAEFRLIFTGQQEKFCYRWERRGDRRDGVKNIAREIITEQSPESALAKDVQHNPELYAFFRVEIKMAVNQIDKKAVEFDFDSEIEGRVDGIGFFSITKHSDRTVTICIIVKNATGGLHPKDKRYYLSQKQADAIRQNPPSSIAEFSCFV